MAVNSRGPRRSRAGNTDLSLWAAGDDGERAAQVAVDQTAARFTCGSVALVDLNPGAEPVRHHFGLPERFLKARAALQPGAARRIPSGLRVTRAAGASADARRLLRPFGYLASIVLPIRADGPGSRPSHLLELYFSSPRDIDQPLRRDLSQWGRDVAAALAACARQQRLLRENRELAALARVSWTVASSLDPERVFEAIRTQLAQLANSRNMLLALAEPERRRFRVIFEYEHGKHAAQSFFPMDRGLAAVIWRTKRTIVTGDYLSECRRRRVRPAGTPARAWLGVPLLHRGDCLGVLLVWEYARGERFVPSGIRMIRHLADQAAAAIANARNHQNDRQRLAEISAINSITRAIARVMDLDALWPLLHEQVGRLMDAANFYVALYHHDRRLLEFAYDVQQGVRRPSETTQLRRGLTEHVIRTKRPLLIRHRGQKVAGNGFASIGKPAQSWLGVPIAAKGAVLGVIAIQHYQIPDRYTERDRELLETIAGQVAVAIENARLYGAARVRAAQMSAFNRVNQAAVAGLNRDQVLKLILEIIKAELGYLNCAVLLPDESGTVLRIRQAFGYPRRVLSTIRLKIGRDGITGRAAFLKRTIYAPDVRKHPGYIRASAQCRSELAIPLLASGAIVGVLDIESDRVDGFHRDDIRLLENFARQASQVIEKVNLEGLTRRRISELSTLFDIFQSITYSADYASLAEQIAGKIAQALGSRKCLIALYDQAGQRISGLTYVSSAPLSPRQRKLYGSAAAMASQFRFSLRQGGIAARVIRSDAPYCTNDARHDRYILKQQARAFDIAKLMVVPMSSRGKVLGLLYAADPADGRDYGEEDMRLGKALAGQAALIIDNARLYHEMGQGLKQVTTLYQMSQAITQATSLGEVLALAIRVVGQLVPADYLSIMLWDRPGGSLVIKASHGLDEATVRDAVFRPGQGLAGWVAQHGQPVISDDVRSDPRFRSIGQSERIGPAISVPLLSGETVLGVLNLDSRPGTGRAFTQEHLQLAATLGGTIALAVERAQLVASLDSRISIQNALMAVGTLLQSSLDSKTVLERISSEIEKLLPFLALAVYAVDWDKRLMRPIIARGPFEQEMLDDLPFSIDSGITGSIARSGIAEIVNDTNNDPRAVHIEGTSDDSQNMMTVPFVVQGRAVAVLSLWRDLGHRFESAELEVASLFANQAAVALNNARLFEEIRNNEQEVADTNSRLNLALKRQIEVNTELSTLQYLSSTILSSLKLEEILSVIVEGIRSSLGFDSVLISMVDPSGQHLEHKAASGIPPEEYEAVMRERPGLQEYLPLMQPECRISNSYYWSRTADPAPAEAFRPPGGNSFARSWHPEDRLLIPLHSKDKELLAIIQVAKPLNDAFPDKKKVRSLEAFANTAVLAIENATLYQQAQSRINELSLLYDIGIVVTSVLETQRLLDSVVRVIRDKLQYLKVALFMVAAQTRGIYTGSQIGYGEELNLAYLSVGGNSLVGQVAERGEPMVINDARVDGQYPVIDERIRSAIAVPIRREGKCIGVLSIEDVRPNAFSDSDVKLLSTLASQVAVALDNARLYEEAKRQISELTVLHDVGTTVGSTLKVESLLSQVCQILQETFRFPKIGVLLADPARSELELVASRGYPGTSGQTGRRLRIGHEGVTGMVAATGEPIIIDDVTKSSHYISIDGNTRSEIAVPLKLAGQVIGVINVESDHLGAFGSLDLRLLSTLASQVAVAVENARLYEQTEQLAVTDGLTGIYNHRYFQDFIERELNRAKRYRHALSLVMLDIDLFKGVNDAHGHPAGDRVLQQVAGVLRKQARDVDLVARYGGEEFMVVLPETRKREAVNIANRIRVQIRDITFKDEHGRDLERITVSLGVASFPEDGADKNLLIDYVDKALYRAKAAGRDQVSS